jgi:hypothetical protein
MNPQRGFVKNEALAWLQTSLFKPQPRRALMPDAKATEADEGKAVLWRDLELIKSAFDLLYERRNGEPGITDELMLLKQLIQSTQGHLQEFDGDIREHQRCADQCVAYSQHLGIKGRPIVKPHFIPRKDITLAKKCFAEGSIAIERDIRKEPHYEVLQAYNIVNFLSKALHLTTGEATAFNDYELEGLGHILEHCAALLEPTLKNRTRPPIYFEVDRICKALFHVIASTNIQAAKRLYLSENNPMYAWWAYLEAKKHNIPIPDFFVEYLNYSALSLLSIDADGTKDRTAIQKALGFWALGRGNCKTRFDCFMNKNEIIWYVVKLLSKNDEDGENGGMTKSEAYEIAANKFGVSYEQVKKWHTEIKETMGNLLKTPFSFGGE